MRASEFIEAHIPEPNKEDDKEKLFDILRDSPSYPKLEEYLLEVKSKITNVDLKTKKFIIDDLIETHNNISNKYGVHLPICAEIRKLVQKLKI